MDIKSEIRSVLILLCIIMMCSSCSASSKEDFKKMILAQKVNGYGKMLKDSVASIVMDAKCISCELQSKSPEDTLRQDTVAKVPSRMRQVLQYLFFNESNFQANDVVYGHFTSWACYRFEASKKRIVYLELDFGIRKWRLLDKGKILVCMGDMKENNMQFLYFTRLLFPGDKTLDLLNKNLNAK